MNATIEFSDRSYSASEYAAQVDAMIRETQRLDRLDEASGRRVNKRRATASAPAASITTTAPTHRRECRGGVLSWTPIRPAAKAPAPAEPSPAPQPFVGKFSPEDGEARIQAKRDRLAVLKAKRGSNTATEFELNELHKLDVWARSLVVSR